MTPLPLPSRRRRERRTVVIAFRHHLSILIICCWIAQSITVAIAFSGSNNNICSSRSRSRSRSSTSSTTTTTDNLRQLQQQHCHHLPFSKPATTTTSSSSMIFLSSSSSSSSSSSDSNKDPSTNEPPPSDQRIEEEKESNNSEDSSSSSTTTTSYYSEVPCITEVDVQYKITTPLHYDSLEDRYVEDTIRKQQLQKEEGQRGGGSRRGNNFLFMIKPMLSSAFIPEGVLPSYFNFMRWRVSQRFVNANLHVIGTQSLLLALGMKSSMKSTKMLGVSAALNWVLKDALGKMARLIWASKMSRKFDSDAKRWRFRASIVFAYGNFLEIVTYMNPQLFLLWATLANAAKQIAMLTSSSTRTALYNSFRDGTRENIGDITAKGEAQIAIVDLCGIASGICLSRIVGTGVKNVLLLYAVLQIMEIFCMYYELKSVQFRVLNFERLAQVILYYVRSHNNSSSSPSSSSSSTTSSSLMINGGKTTTNNSSNKKGRAASAAVASTTSTVSIPTPEEMSQTERIFLPPKHLSRRGIAFGSLGRAKLSPDELDRLMTIFANERFLLIVGQNVKQTNPKSTRRKVQLGGKRGGGGKKRRRKRDLAEECHIVLHEDASNADIVKSTVALIILREKLRKSEKELSNHRSNLRSNHCYDILEETQIECNNLFPSFLRELSNQKWAPPSRFMFGRVHKRAHWPLKQRRREVKTNNNNNK